MKAPHFKRKIAGYHHITILPEVETYEDLLLISNDLLEKFPIQARYVSSEGMFYIYKDQVWGRDRSSNEDSEEG